MCSVILLWGRVWILIAKSFLDRIYRFSMRAGLLNWEQVLSIFLGSSGGLCNSFQLFGIGFLVSWLDAKNIYLRQWSLGLWFYLRSRRCIFSINSRRRVKQVSRIRLIFMKRIHDAFFPTSAYSNWVVDSVYSPFQS